MSQITDASFTHFTNLAVDEGVTAEYVINEVSVNGVSPTLLVRTSSLENRAYKNAMVRATGKSAQMALARGKIGPTFVEDNREMDRDLYAKHVVVGWRDMYKATGEEVVYSLEEAANLMRIMPAWMFDELRGFCGNPDNFNSGSGHVEVEERAKKSPKTLPGT